MKPLEKALVDGSFLLDLNARSMPELIAKTLDFVVERGKLAADDREAVEQALLEREALGSTAIGNAFAVPHAYLDVFDEPVILFVRLSHGVNLGAPDHVPSRFVFILLGPTGAVAQHLDALAGIARLMLDDEFRYEAGVARTQVDLLQAVRRFSARAAQPEVPSERAVPEGLIYTGRLFGGVAADFRRRWAHYGSDFRDGLHVKTIASTLFLFFACMAPAVTFGGIMAELTGNQIGAVEMILASAICGVAYALFAGQPLIILGGTGPLLVFTWLLYLMCQQLGLGEYFLETRAWVGLWTALLLAALAVTDSSCLVRYFTRFTDEIFAALISIIFIYAALEALIHIVREVYAEETVSHDRALVPLLLAGGTFYIATSLSRFRRSRYLWPGMREFLADFGPTIALAVMATVAVGWFYDVDLTMMPAPETFRPTADRAWFVNLFAVPKWVWLASLGPAILVTVLAYVDQNITARLVNSPDHKLHKGEAYHYDLLLLSVLIAFCSLFGLPWLVAATVRSLNHLRSLATLEEVVTSEGTVRERVIHVRETRLTGLSIHLLIGASLLLLPLFQAIPMSVLYGLFLFMGVVSMAGNQFLSRMSLWATDPAIYPATHYMRRVPMATIHKFTAIQVACLAALALVEMTPAALVFPLLLVLLVPLRMWLGRFFEEEHLAALDAEEEPDEEELQWV